MKKIIYFLSFVTLISTSKKKKKNRIVAEVYNKKLFESEVVDNIPSGLFKEDSLAMFDLYVNNWLKNQVLLHEADKKLTLKEKNFDEQIRKYKEHLLIEAYFNKITEDSLKFLVSDKELKHFIGEYKESEPVQQNVVRVNYVKLSKKSSVGNQIKEILFNDQRRVAEKKKLTQLCGDSIEYFLEDNQWMLLDYLEQDFPFNIDDKEALLSDHKNIDVSDNQYRYLVVFLDFKTQYTPSETVDEQNSIRSMLIQQKKVKYINKLKESLLQQAIDNEEIIQ